MREVAIALVLGLLAGCGGSDGGAGGSARSDEPVRTDWWLTEAVDGAELSVTVYVGSSSCTTFDRVDVDERDTTVEVLAYVVTQELRPDVECTADYGVTRQDLVLTAPLGDRELTGCVAPPGAHRAEDRPHDASVDCAAVDPVDGS